MKLFVLYGARGKKASLHIYVVTSIYSSPIYCKHSASGARSLFYRATKCFQSMFMKWAIWKRSFKGQKVTNEKLPKKHNHYHEIVGGFKDWDQNFPQAMKNERVKPNGNFLLHLTLEFTTMKQWITRLKCLKSYFVN